MNDLLFSFLISVPMLNRQNPCIKTLRHFVVTNIVIILINDAKPTSVNMGVIPVGNTN